MNGAEVILKTLAANDLKSMTRCPLGSRYFPVSLSISACMRLLYSSDQ
jgi:hypothetical protein